MPTTSEAFVTPTVLRWARDRARVTPSIVAKKIGAKPESITSWESGESRPTFHQAEQLAKKLYIPFPYLFLPSPPTEHIPLADFRTVGNERFEPSPALIDVLNDVLAKHTWYREFVQTEGQSEHSFVGSFSIDDDIGQIAQSIATTLGITDELRDSCVNWENFLTKLIDLAHQGGILVMRSGIVANNPHRRLRTEEFRGFAISDPLAPLVFVNGADFKAAQIFTVAHELCHIWLGTSGISNESLGEPDPSDLERKCDAVAAEVLTPTNRFLDKWEQSHQNINQLAHYFRVSSLVILRKGRDLRLLTQKQFHDQFEAEKKKFTKRAQDGGHFYRTLLTRNSALFTSTVISAVAEGRELYRNAAQLLNVRVDTLPKIADFLRNKSSA